MSTMFAASLECLVDMPNFQPPFTILNGAAPGLKSAFHTSPFSTFFSFLFFFCRMFKVNVMTVPRRDSLLTVDRRVYRFVCVWLQVELVRAPEGSVLGERVRVEGSEGDPLTPAQVSNDRAEEVHVEHIHEQVTGHERLLFCTKQCGPQMANTEALPRAPATLSRVADATALTHRSSLRFLQNRSGSV